MTRTRLIRFTLLAGIAAAGSGVGIASADDGGGDLAAATCEGLAEGLTGTLRVESARHIPAGPAELQVPMGGGRYRTAPFDAPDHCAITGRFEERTGADGMAYGFRVEMRLPLEWNGGLVFQGGGGLNGSVNPALGNLPSSSSAPSALDRGFAVISTDSGHDAAITPGASFARDQQAMLNYAYASVGKVVRVGRSVVDGYYGRQPDRTYYWGCSNGGREALIAAQRYPEQFDGIIAMNPAFELSRAVMLAHFSTLTYHALGMPGDPAAISLPDMQLVSRSVLDQCDALDGREDGLIFNHAACHYDPQVLQCAAGQNEGCLSSEKIDVLQRAFAGPLEASGEPAFGSWPWDAGVGEAGWLAWQTGLYDPATGQTFDYFPALIREGTARYFFHPPVSDEEFAAVDHSCVPEAMRVVAGLTDADSTQFSTFVDRGGKMILMTGWSDPIFSASRLTQWYEQLGRDTAQTGGDAESFSRLFLNPGMNHCAGGAALDDMDLLGALDGWVVEGRAPDSLVVTGDYLPGQSRPLCQYPAYAHYTGAGDGNDAASYECRLPES